METSLSQSNHRKLQATSACLNYAHNKTMDYAMDLKKLMSLCPDDQQPYRVGYEENRINPQVDVRKEYPQHTSFFSYQFTSNHN